MSRKPSKAMQERIDTIVEFIRADRTLSGDQVVARLPMTDREALNCFRLYGDIIGERTNREVMYSRAEYQPTGNGPFGRYGNRRGGYSRARVFLGEPRCPACGDTWDCGPTYCSWAGHPEGGLPVDDAERDAAVVRALAPVFVKARTLDEEWRAMDANDPRAISKAFLAGARFGQGHKKLDAYLSDSERYRVGELKEAP